MPFLGCSQLDHSRQRAPLGIDSCVGDCVCGNLYESDIMTEQSSPILTISGNPPTAPRVASKQRRAAAMTDPTKNHFSSRESTGPLEAITDLTHQSLFSSSKSAGHPVNWSPKQPWQIWAAKIYLLLAVSKNHFLFSSPLGNGAVIIFKGFHWHQKTLLRFDVLKQTTHLEMVNYLYLH